MGDIDCGFIGGSGLYAMEGFHAEERLAMETPFGKPSDEFVVGRIGGARVAFLPRHGVGHRLLPSEVNYRANIFGFKLLGVDTLFAVGAVGSLQERYRPGDVVVPDQLVDRTRHRPDTFFGEGIVAHVGFADPFCPLLRERLAEASRGAGLAVHMGGAYLCMEGPLFSTRAESQLYRGWGMDIIGMTGLQEAKLAREAEICFANLALVTDYDCWHDEVAPVAIADILKVFAENVKRAQEVMRRVAGTIQAPGTCACRRALDHAIITRRDLWPPETVDSLRPLIARFLGGEAPG